MKNRFAVHLVELDSTGKEIAGSCAILPNLDLDQLSSPDVQERHLLPALLACLRDLKATLTAA